jgi:hypothetical protein
MQTTRVVDAVAGLPNTSATVTPTRATPKEPTMKRNILPSALTLPRAIGTLSLVAMLAACGGGSNDAPPPNNNVSADGAKNATANTTSIPNDSATAMSAVVSTAEAVVAAGSANVTVACAGGGTAAYTVTGPSATLLNHQLDQGENYSLVFANCRGAAGASSVNGAFTLAVTTKTANSITLDTATNNVVVTLPHGDVALNGSSTISRTTDTVGNVTTTTSHWVTPNFSVVSHRNGKITSFSYTNVDLTRTEVRTSGQFTSASFNGTATLSWMWPGGSFSVTLATQGTVGCAEDGSPTQGMMVITLPNDRITITVVPGTVTVTVDYGKDGTIDATYIFTTTEVVNGG